MTWFSLLLMLVGTSQAGDFYLEGPTRNARSEVVVMSRAAAAEGYKARVVSRYNHGVGWEYLVRVEGYAAEADAVRDAEVISSLIGGAVEVLNVEEDYADAPMVTVQKPPKEEDDKTEKNVTKPLEDPERSDIAGANSVLKLALRAHGGAAGGTNALAASDAVSFAFTRSLPDGAVVEHLWIRRGADLYLEVTPLKGEGLTRSRTLVLGDKAWLAVGEGEYVEQDLDKTRDALSDFGPSRVVPFVLSFGGLLAEDTDLQELRYDGAHNNGSAKVHRLRYDGDRASEPFSIDIDAETGRVRRFVQGEDALVVEFDGWLGEGTAVPHPRVVKTSQHGASTDQFEITGLDLSPSISNAWFKAP